jgi:hypothetical protein
VSKVWLADTVRGRLHCLGRLGSTGLIAGDSTGMAGTVPWVGCGVCSTLSTDIDSRTGLLVISSAGWLVWTAYSVDRHGCWWTRTMITDD